MKRPETTMKDPYAGRRREVLQAAANLYRGAKASDGEFDFEDPASRVNPAVGSGSKKDMARSLHAAEAQAYELTTSARMLAKTAFDLDQLNMASGFNKIIPFMELTGRVITEPFEVARISRSGLVGELRTLDLHGQVENLTEDLRQ